jgi:hypothetical protein
MVAGPREVANIGNQEKLKKVVFRKTVLRLFREYKEVLVLKTIRLLYALHPSILHPFLPGGNKKRKIVHRFMENSAW